MFLRFQNFAQNTKSAASSIFSLGLFFIVFGLLTILLSKIFIFIVAGLFFMIGIGCVSSAVKLFWNGRKFSGGDSAGKGSAFRENVRVHEPDDDDTLL